MAKEYEYPLKDIDELDRVSQFVAIEHGDMVPKNFIVRWLSGSYNVLMYQWAAVCWNPLFGIMS